MKNRSIYNICSAHSVFLFQSEIVEIALDQCGQASERHLAIVDKNRDLFLTKVRVYGSARKTVKLGKNLFQ